MSHDPRYDKEAADFLAADELIRSRIQECAVGNADPSVLLEAQSLVHGNRQADYGHPIHDYSATGRIWGAILERWLRSIGFPLPESGFPDVDPRVCTVMMAGVKLSREAGKHKRDNNVDTAGYAECTEMIARRQEEAA